MTSGVLSAVWTSGSSREETKRAALGHRWLRGLWGLAPGGAWKDGDSLCPPERSSLG